MRELKYHKVSNPNCSKLFLNPNCSNFYFLIVLASRVVSHSNQSNTQDQFTHHWLMKMYWSVACYCLMGYSAWGLHARRRRQSHSPNHWQGKFDSGVCVGSSIVGMSDSNPLPLKVQTDKSPRGKERMDGEWSNRAIRYISFLSPRGHLNNKSRKGKRRW